MTPFDALAELLGPQNCLRTPEDLAPYATDWRRAVGVAPQAVLRPGSTAEVAEAVRRCMQQGLAIVPAGGRTGLAGGAVAIAGGPPAVVLSLERLNRIREVDARDFSIVAEAGCVVQKVQQAATEVDRLFPIMWGAQGSAMVGGMLSTNTGGIRTIRWGNARELVLGLEVVLPDGRVLDDLRRVRKDNSGYALRHLFIGAEGTLGIITAAAMRLVPPMRAVETAFVAVPSPDAALSLLSRALGAGAEVVAFELVRRICLEIVARHGPQLRIPLPLESPWYVMVELAAPHAAVPVRQMLETMLFEGAEAGELTDAAIAESEAQRAAFWRIREDYPEFSRMAGPAISTDTAVPVSAVPEFLRRAEAALAARWPEGEMVAIGHAGDGNIHLGLKAPEGMTREAWVARAGEADMVVNEIAVSLGGSFSAEHGIGVAKLHAMRALKDPLAVEVMRSLKRSLDPRGLMNPGKVLPANFEVGSGAGRMLTVYLTHTAEALANYYGEPALAALRRVATVRLNDTGRHLAGRELAEAAHGCEAIISYRQSPGEAATFAHAPDLVAFLRCAVDIRNVDVPAASAAGVLVTRATPGFVDSVTELVLGLMVDLARGVGAASDAYHRGEVPVARMGMQLAGATLGVIGHGAIGRRLATVAAALGMQVLVSDPVARVPAGVAGVEQVPFEALLAGSDIVVCLALATEATENLMDAAAFARMRRGAFFINPSRGNLVDEAALRAVLDRGHLAGAAMDVGRAPDQMPTPALAAHPRVIATPHIGGLTPAAIGHQAMDTVRQVTALAEGRMPDHAVNADAAHRLARLGIGR